MKIRNFYLQAGNAILILSFCCLAISCKNENKEQDETSKSEISQDSEDSEKDVITIVTNSMEFQTKDTVAAGWNTFEYRNKSNETHFVLFDKYPEGKGLEDAKSVVAPIFQEGMDLINEGKMEEAGAAFGKLSEWYQEVEFKGGVGLLSPKSTAQSTIYLEPGTYVIECYVKMPNGVFHTTQGMAKELTVVEKNKAGDEAEADYSIAINVNEGIKFDENVTSGKKTFAVNYGEQKVHENYLMHDVHLVRAEEGADMSKLSKWMNWADPEGLQTPAPGGFKFLGGMQEMKEGGTGYFTAELRPGKYVLISEVPDPESKGLFKTFTVK